MHIEKTDRKRFIIGILLITIFIILFSVTTYKFYPYLSEVKNSPDKIEEIKEIFESFGSWGIFALICIQILQVVISIIPGGPFQIVAGVLYGTLFGFLASFIGMFAGSIIVFFMVKLFKTKFISLFMDTKKLEEYKFLKDSPRLELILAILFFIPGAPKDTLIYYVAFVGMELKKYIFITVIMRLPAMLFSTMIGNNIGNGNLKVTIILSSILVLAGGIGLWFHNKHIKK